MLLAVGAHLSDETNLDRLLPYLISFLFDDNGSVRGAALRALTQTVG